MPKEKLKYSMLIQWSEQDNKYLVYLPEWRNEVQKFVTHGSTYEEAAKQGREVLEMLVENAEGNLPNPRKAEYAWTAEDEECYNAHQAPPQLIISGEDDDDAQRYQIAVVNEVLKAKGENND